ncbi:VirD4-like conjugal transfer protein, CD1115 family [Microbacterium testaceum]|uniref:VirD4-like conjugal transfer protein, CD1115 family n=1 Tax=Microbacterium testaceum TaxID=2033 RepID=UPI0007341C16|nr:type IV secretory system conjugative DNA transfer family protein [Microbacterium testaceum]
MTPGKGVGLLLGAAAIFYVVDRAVEHGRLVMAAGGRVNDVLPAIPGAIAGDPFRISTDPLDLISGLAAAVVLALIVLYTIAGKQNTRPGEEHGSAAWAKPADIKPYLAPDRNPARQLQFTQTEALSVDTFHTRRNCNVLVIGASGTGKTRSYILPNLRHLDASTAITDPSGEIIRDTQEGLAARGITVRSLNLIDLAQSAQFNPMRYFDPDSPETSIAMLSDTIMMNTSGKDSRGDAFWERAEKALLTAIVAYVWATTPHTLEQEPNLLGALDLLKGMDGSEENKDARESETDLKFIAARDVVAEWQKAPNGDDDPRVMDVLQYACDQYRTYEQGPVETRKSVVISLAVRLAPLDMREVRRILATDTLGIDRLGYEPTAMFLQIPDTHATFKFIAAMFWQSLFEQSVYQADHEPDGRLPRMLHCFLDEFANIGRIPNFERHISTIRKRQISVSMVFQNYAQGEEMFEKSWHTVIGNCDTKLFLGGDDPQTTKWVSEMLGAETIVSKDTSRTYGMTGSWSESTRTMRRNLLDPDEVGRLDNSEALLMIRGLRPFRSKKISF